MHFKITHFRYFFAFIITFCNVLIPLSAQRSTHSFGGMQKQIQRDVFNVGAHYNQKLDTLVKKYRTWHYAENDTLSNPYYASLFTANTLYSAALNRQFQLDSNIPDGDIVADNSLLRKSESIVQATDTYLVDVYASTPWLIKNQEVSDGTIDVATRIKDAVKSDNHLIQETIADLPSTPLIDDNDELQVVIRKPNFWDVKANFAFQFTQNYMSDNWYKGGESNMALLTSAVIEANYNNQRKLTFDNCLEMKIGFQMSQNDNEHKFKTNSDLIRLTNKVGYRAIKYWYYTMMLQSWTQFYRGYKANDTKIYSDFMSPFESLLSLGMEYQRTTKNNKFNIKATLSPLALKLKYCDRKSLVTSFGINEGHHAHWDYGSNVTIKYTWKMAKNISWEGRIYYFTDYSKTQLEWENTFDLAINKYLTTRLFLYPRFDDSVKGNKDKKYLQFNELLSLGLKFNI